MLGLKLYLVFGGSKIVGVENILFLKQVFADRWLSILIFDVYKSRTSLSCKKLSSLTCVNFLYFLCRNKRERSYVLK